MLKLRGTFAGEYISFDLVASMTRLQHLLAAHLDQHYPGEHVTVTVTLHPEARGRVSRRHEEYVFAPVWDGRVDRLGGSAARRRPGRTGARRPAVRRCGSGRPIQRGNSQLNPPKQWSRPCALATPLPASPAS